MHRFLKNILKNVSLPLRNYFATADNIHVYFFYFLVLIFLHALLAFLELLNILFTNYKYNRNTRYKKLVLSPFYKT